MQPLWRAKRTAHSKNDGVLSRGSSRVGRCLCACHVRRRPRLIPCNQLQRWVVRENTMMTPAQGPRVLLVCFSVPDHPA